tara:strand:- start:1618 stop:3705 length:2088 start_codon:yes stop_codon:yes gene_type:complete
MILVVNFISASETIGLYDPLNSKFHLYKNSSDNNFNFLNPPLPANLVPLTGDWNGDGIDTIGLYDPVKSEFHLKNYQEGYWIPENENEARTYYSDILFKFQVSGNNLIPLTGDWNGDGIDTIGLYDPITSKFHLKNENDIGDADYSFQFGSPNSGWTPLIGDWNGDGIDTIGLYDPTNSQFHLKNSFSGGDADHHFGFGSPNSGWTPLIGDWNGDGIDTIGLYDQVNSQFHLKNSFAGGDADYYFGFGSPNSGWTPLIGDWNGDGIDTIGLYDSTRITLEQRYDPVQSEFHLKNSFTGGNADIRVGFGWKTDYISLTGDWNNDGIDTIGLYDPISSRFYLKNTNSLGNADINFQFGNPYSGWLPISGDWNGDGIDTIGLYDSVKSEFHLKNSFSGGNADILFQFGEEKSEWWPISGDWNGDGIDTIGLYFREKSEFHLKNSFSGGNADYLFQVGKPLEGYPGVILGWPGNFPIVGDWNNDGVDTVGLYDPENSIFYLVDSFSNYQLESTDIIISFGYPNRGWWPIAGTWESNKTIINERDTINKSNLNDPSNISKSIIDSERDTTNKSLVNDLSNKTLHDLNLSEGINNIQILNETYYVFNPSRKTGPIEISDKIQEEDVIVICNGCEKDGKCFPFDYRINEKYCSIDKEFVTQLRLESHCNDNFECDSNLCIYNECVSGSLWARFMRWLSRLLR